MLIQIYGLFYAHCHAGVAYLANTYKMSSKQLLDTAAKEGPLAVDSDFYHALVEFIKSWIHKNQRTEKRDAHHLCDFPKDLGYLHAISKQYTATAISILKSTGIPWFEPKNANDTNTHAKKIAGAVLKQIRYAEKDLPTLLKHQVVWDMRQELGSIMDKGTDGLFEQFWDNIEEKPACEDDDDNNAKMAGMPILAYNIVQRETNAMLASTQTICKDIVKLVTSPHGGTIAKGDGQYFVTPMVDDALQALFIVSLCHPCCASD
jgi:hypothetical protein